MKENRYLTKDEAVVWLMVWRENNVPRFNLDYVSSPRSGITSGMENVYLNGLLDELIDRIRLRNMDPVSVVAEYYYEMDDILVQSDVSHCITHRFASYMEDAAHDILFYLKQKEKEMNAYERERMVRRSVQRSL